jgi:DNA polymerase III delta prime subunit
MHHFHTTTGDRRKAARIHFATLVSDRPQLDYAVRKVALRARISAAQASVIAELIGLAQDGDRT